MPTIAQMQIRYDAGEDRMLLRVRSSDGGELRFWLTQRYLRLAWPMLTSQLGGAPAVARAGASAGSASSPQARRELAAFEHQSAVQAADFQTPFEEAAKSLPLGETPILLARFSLVDKGPSGVVLSLHPSQGQGVELALSRNLLHSLGKLVADAAGAADWALPASLPTTLDAPQDGVAH